MNGHHRRAALLLGCSMLVAACAERPPVAEPPPPPAAQTGVYIVVERGQSLDRIAQLYRVSKRDIIAANNLTPPYALKPGAVLQIPRVTAAAQPAKPPTPPKATPSSATPTSATPTSATPKKPDRSAETAAPAPRSRPKRPPADVIPLD